MIAAAPSIYQTSSAVILPSRRPDCHQLLPGLAVLATGIREVCISRLSRGLLSALAHPPGLRSASPDLAYLSLGCPWGVLLSHPTIDILKVLKSIIKSFLNDL